MHRRTIAFRQLAALSLLIACSACIGNCEENDPPPQRAECDTPDAADAVVVDALEIRNPRASVGLQGSGMLMFDVRMTGPTLPGCAGVSFVVRDPSSGVTYESGTVSLQMDEVAGAVVNRESHWMLWQFPNEVELEVTAYGHTETVQLCQYGCDDGGGVVPDAGP
ncbi:MAG: hypothetical protein KC619_00185 [Myxococcales bacterium]|nr:hypothetical protein [Myxococcales bacterium]